MFEITEVDIGVLAGELLKEHIGPLTLPTGVLREHQEYIFFLFFIHLLDEI